MIVTGYWLLVAGCWVLGTGYWVLFAGYWILGAGFFEIRCFCCLIKFDKVLSNEGMKEMKEMKEYIDILTARLED
jgi:hypothetical protein